MKIWANCIVHNEENFVWFAIMSVVDYVDKILIWDTGSTDKTVEIIKEAIRTKGEKIEFKEVGLVDKHQFTKMRQAQLEESKCDWILVLDGDEIWWKDSIKKLLETIKKHGDKLEAIVVPFYSLVGDIYHYQSQSAGQYQLLGKKGHLTIKAINRKTSNLHWSQPYGKEGLFCKNDILIQDKSNNLSFLDTPFLHLTHLKRSSISQEKFKHDLGISFSKDFKFPEVFYENYPELVPSPWVKRSKKYETISRVKQPLQFIWRTAKNKFPQK